MQSPTIWFISELCTIMFYSITHHLFFIYLFEYINHNAKNKFIPQFVHVHEFQINWATGSYIYRFFPSIRPPEF